MRASLAVLAALFMSAGNAASAAGHRAVVEKITVPTDAVSAWRLWTTNEGFQSFFPGGEALETNIELRPGGPYQVFIIKDAPAGSRGCDDCVILGYEEGRMISFTWTNRPDMAVRPHKSHVTVNFEPIGAETTRVTLVADGWGAGPDFDVAFAYFDEAWASVLSAFKARIEAGAAEGND